MRPSQCMTAYEELRKLIDGGSESMTHEDAVDALRTMVEAWNELEELRRYSVEVAATEIWTSIRRFDGQPNWHYGISGWGRSSRMWQQH